MISHALDPVRRPDATVDWDRWIAAGFAVGAACFFIGPFPGFVQLVGEGRRRRPQIAANAELVQTAGTGD